MKFKLTMIFLFLESIGSYAANASEMALKAQSVFSSDASSAVDCSKLFSDMNIELEISGTDIVIPAKSPIKASWIPARSRYYFSQLSKDSSGRYAGTVIEAQLDLDTDIFFYSKQILGDGVAQPETCSGLIKFKSPADKTRARQIANASYEVSKKKLLKELDDLHKKL